MSSQTVIIRRILPVSCEEVFDAWLDPDGMSQWMCPGPVTATRVTMEPRVGGRFHIVMNAPNVEYVHHGEFRRLDRPSTLQFTWVSSRMGNEETFVTIELRTRGAGCELVLTHERVPENHSAAGLQGGWGQILDKLARNLAAVAAQAAREEA